MLYTSGIYGAPKDALTPEGYELQFGINALGPYYFTKLLIPILISSAPTSSDTKTRIITISSVSHLRAPKGGVRWETLQGNGDVAMKGKKSMSEQVIYAQSKWVRLGFI